jgi:hypothetical protein
MLILKNMKEENLLFWDDFEDALRKREAWHAAMKSKGTAYISELLYRGQASSKWKLETTLERRVAAPLSLLDYYKLIWSAKSHIGTFTDKTWKIPSIEKYEDWLQKHSYPHFNFEAYEYFAYLRHHGFPSPLLDWTASPYIAAFFAMDKVADKAEKVSVYVYCEYSEGEKGSADNCLAIQGIGPNVRAHRRHFLQQSRYTICTAIKNREYVYARHNDVVSMNETGQDLLWKFNIPVTERYKVLHKLNKMNINSFTLFDTEDSLIDTIATNILPLQNSLE